VSVSNPLFSARSELTSTECHLYLSGVVDENVSFQNLAIPPDRSLHLHLSEVLSLNSVGLRSWVLWIRDLDVPEITMHRCPTVVIHQLNILEGFFPNGAVVKSFAVPYVCESCGTESTLWTERDRHFRERSLEKPEWIDIPEAQTCEQCGGTAAIDVIPKKYFNFLRIVK
jgi:hypothetical protein